MEEKEYFFCLVPLTVNYVIIKVRSEFEFWNYSDEEVLSTILEELDCLDDSPMGHFYNI
mgnify:CR=1 FL=1|jgi:hypothetical protein